MTFPIVPKWSTYIFKDQQLLPKNPVNLAIFQDDIVGSSRSTDTGDALGQGPRIIDFLGTLSGSVVLKSVANKQVC